MNVSMIAIGDELLIGQVVDTNSGDIARFLAPYGWMLKSVQVAADSEESIKLALDRALADSDVVLTSGGLGPTKDDITKRVLCQYFGGELREDPQVLDNVKEIFRAKGFQLNDLTRAQALVPTSCRVIQNLAGTAPIMWFERNDKVVVCMPGVPLETRRMFPEAVLPQLLKRFGQDLSIRRHTITTTGISESKLAMHLEAWESALPSWMHLAYLPAQGIIRLRLEGFNSDASALNDEFDRQLDKMRTLTADYLLYDGGRQPQEVLLELLAARSLSVATAESCTGGNIARLLTSIPGSSQSMLGGIVAYSNAVKTSVLGVCPATLDTHGAVSIPTVEEMVSGVCTRLNADVAIATSGIAGPGGAVEGKPVGTVCIAVKTPDKLFSDTFHFAGGRQQVIERASLTAITIAIKMLSDGLN